MFSFIANMGFTNQTAFAAHSPQSSPLPKVVNVKCTSNAPLWGTLNPIFFSYDPSEKIMSLSFEMDNQKTILTGEIDSSYTPRTKNKIRFQKKDGNTNFDELTTEAYICNIMASKSLLSAVAGASSDRPSEKSNDRSLNLTCRGESFENSYYNCE